jgi:hypothetical protein
MLIIAHFSTDFMMSMNCPYKHTPLFDQFIQKYKSLTKLIEIALKSRCGLTHIAGWSGMKKRGQKEQPFGKFLLPLGKN